MPKTTYEYDELSKLYEKSQEKLGKKKEELTEKEAELIKLEKRLKEAEAERDKYKEKKAELKKELKQQSSSSSVPSDYDKQKEKAKKYKEYKNAFGGKGADEIKRELTNAKEENEKLEKKLAKKKEKIGELKKASSNVPSKSVEVVDSTSLGLYQDKITELNKEIKDKENAFQALKEEWEESNKRLEQLMNAKPDTLNQTAEVVREEWVKAVETGVEAGGKVFPIFGTGAGALIGAGIGGVGFATHATLYAAEKAAEHGENIYNTTLEAGKELAEKTGDNITDVTKNISDNTANVATTAVDRGADVTIEVIKATDKAREGLKDHVEHHADNVKEVTEKVLDNFHESVTNLFHTIETGINAGTGVDALKGQLELAKEKMEFLVKELGKKDAQIEKLEREKDKLDKRIEKLEEREDRLMAQVEEVVKSRPSSPLPVYSK